MSVIDTATLVGCQADSHSRKAQVEAFVAALGATSQAARSLPPPAV
jgi:hypothetical protein